MEDITKKLSADDMQELETKVKSQYAHWLNYINELNSLSDDISNSLSTTDMTNDESGTNITAVV